MIATLFDKPEVSNFKLTNLLPKDGLAFFYPGFFSKNESESLYKSLLNTIVWQQDHIKMFGKRLDLPRLTAWYGDLNKTYTYSGIPMNPKIWTPALLDIKSRVEEVAQVEFSSVLLNLYRNGQDSVSWHSDDEPELGNNPVIGSVSFGATRRFRMRHIHDKSLVKEVALSDGSFLLMLGETQHYWEHEIPKSAKVTEARINLTFRVIK
jgi:alkylated DNA repair dioxygenase AlkB